MAKGFASELRRKQPKLDSFGSYLQGSCKLVEKFLL